jgi:hypothetical protein
MKLVKPLLLLLTSTIIVGCATVPTLRVSQPWIRSLKAPQAINPIAKVKVEVSGTTTPLLGNEQLTANEIRERLSYLLKRRGFAIENASTDYVVQLSYKTERGDKFRFSSAVASTNVQAYAIATGSGAGATSGLGVSVARAVSAVASRSSIVSEQTAEQMLSYTHTIAIELRNKEGLVLWKGESTWDSNQLDLIGGIFPAIQLILSDLPSDKLTRPEIREVKRSHVNNFYKLECEDRWFTCPALPYRILFEVRKINPKEKTSIPSNLKDEFALGAYVDLIQTAEFALPSGDEDDWKDPIQVSLWEKVTLGGQYLLGTDRKPVNILIKLVGRSDGYYIDECKVASEEEFSRFSGQFSKWRQALRDYYDVYVQ